MSKDIEEMLNEMIKEEMLGGVASRSDELQVNQSLTETLADEIREVHKSRVKFMPGDMVEHVMPEAGYSRGAAKVVFVRYLDAPSFEYESTENISSISGAIHYDAQAMRVIKNGESYIIAPCLIDSALYRKVTS
jgi:hypothetical protein